MVDVAQLVRALVCGTRGRGFESLLPPQRIQINLDFFIKTFMFIAFRIKICYIKGIHWGVAKW